MADAQAAAWPTVAQLSGTSYFRVQAANHLAPLLQITPQQVFEVLEAPRQSEHGDIALPVPRLNKFSKVKGNPAELAAQIAAKVGALARDPTFGGHANATDALDANRSLHRPTPPTALRSPLPPLNRVTRARALHSLCRARR